MLTIYLKRMDKTGLNCFILIIHVVFSCKKAAGKPLVGCFLFIYTSTYTQGRLTCDLASDGKTLHRARVRNYRNLVIHIWNQVWDGGFSRRWRHREFFCWFSYKNAHSQREAIRKLLHDLISPRVKTGLQKKPDSNPRMRRAALKQQRDLI